MVPLVGVGVPPLSSLWEATSAAPATNATAPTPIAVAAPAPRPDAVAPAAPDDEVVVLVPGAAARA
ncbi:hypothetical protein FCN80_18210 [Martelella alba]|uniref:Uncharacterized protein n=1 Tax=Martelella alba TaxID=2590451 RepID=A0ABY2SI25_9HYPH|nr:hypothetical protein FCN80_18210 [Martelella alba]